MLEEHVWRGIVRADLIDHLHVVTGLCLRCLVPPVERVAVVENRAHKRNGRLANGNSCDVWLLARVGALVEDVLSHIQKAHRADGVDLR